MSRAISLARRFQIGLDSWPDAPLVVHSDYRSWHGTLADVAARGEEFAAQLSDLGVAPGDAVVIMLPAWQEWMVAAVGAARLGAIMVPVIPQLGMREVAHILAQCGAQTLVTPGRWRSVDYGSLGRDLRSHFRALRHIAVDEVPDGAVPLSPRRDSPAPTAGPDPDDVALIVYTSGTTSVPKGVRHSARTVGAELDSQDRAAPLDRTQAILSPWPPGHIAGVIQMFRFLAQGVPTILMDQWDARVAAELVEKHRVTTSSGTPFHLASLLDAAERDQRDLSSLKSYLTGAAPVPAPLVARCDHHGIATYRAYGSSEHPTVTMGSPDDPLEKRLSTEGRLLPGVEVRFLDEKGNDVPAGQEGEIASRGPDRFLGYQDKALDAHAFLPGGWYLSGDIGRMDADGYLVITDRKKDIIIRGGENISSREVEDVLELHPAVSEAAVVAAPDSRMGEIACAVVVPVAGEEITLEQIGVHFRRHGVSRYKTPEQLLIVNELPRNSSGKIMKHLLRRKLQQVK